MACTSPLWRIPIGSRCFNLLLPLDQNRLRNKGVFLTLDALQVYESNPLWQPNEVQQLRCGQCADCRLAYSRDWAIRCSLEASLHQFNYFITLTYDDCHLPRGEFIDYKGDLYDSALLRRDVQLFIKRLREHERIVNGNTGIKVFYCGEYGDSNGRPHYHLCVFGMSEIPDLRWTFKKKSFNYYKSDIIEKCWSVKVAGIDVPRGFVDISECTFDTIAYTARYVMKKQKGLIKSNFIKHYETLDPELRPELRPDPFIGMSLKPGIAAEYFKLNARQILSEDKVKYQNKWKLFLSKPPRYFDKLLERDSPLAFSVLKKLRKHDGLNANTIKLYSESFSDRLHRQAKINDSNVRRLYVRH